MLHRHFVCQHLGFDDCRHCWPEFVAAVRNRVWVTRSLQDLLFHMVRLMVVHGKVPTATSSISAVSSVTAGNSGSFLFNRKSSRRLHSFNFNWKPVSPVCGYLLQYGQQRRSGRIQQEIKLTEGSEKDKRELTQKKMT